MVLWVLALVAWWLVRWLLGEAAWLLVRWVLVPLGAARAARAVARLAARKLRRDPRGGALMAAAWALIRTRGRAGGRADAHGAQLAWLEARLGSEPGLRGGGVVARGLLSALRGDDEQARVTLRGAFDMDPALLPEVAEALAAHYLVADAARRGAWDEARQLGWADGRPRFAATRVVGIAAARFTATPSSRRPEDAAAPCPDARALRYWFVRAGSPEALRPLFLRALVTRPEKRRPSTAARPSAPALPPDLPGEPLPRALFLHARALRRHALFLSLSDLQELAQAWTAALDGPELRALCLRRAIGLGADGEAAQRGLAEALQADLAELAHKGRVPLHESALSAAGAGPLLRASARRLREGLLDELEAGCAALSLRVEDNRGLPLLDEWREWEALRRRYELGVRLCGEPLRRLIWPTYHRALCGHGVWMFNQRGERIFGNTVARYLLSEAESLGDDERATLQRKNVACGT
ncbi:MAG: hypothetical protein U1A78_22840 [Polyangia bacterium]